MTSALTAKKGNPLVGRINVPGDKSISHRAILCGLLALGETTVHGLLEAHDVLHTIENAKRLGATIYKDENQVWHVHGVGIGALLPPLGPLDFGNAGTGSRLMMGVVASHPIKATFDGDASLRKRPMARVLNPLQKVGMRILNAQEGLKLPLTMQGATFPTPFEHTLEVASAQVKSALMFAALNTQGICKIIEPIATRDHTEKMFKAFGANIKISPMQDGSTHITVQGGTPLKAQNVIVPADPSSAAFPIVAALIVPNSNVLIRNVMMNPLRTGLLQVLLQMGASIEVLNINDTGAEEIADLRVKSSILRGIEVSAQMAPSMIDEYPILAIAAAFAKGTTSMHGLEELRVKESDRLQGILDILSAAGVSASVEGDTLHVQGASEVEGGFCAKTHMDHRLAMSALVMGLASKKPISIDEDTMIATSFPNFIDLMRDLGAHIAP